MFLLFVQIFTSIDKEEMAKKGMIEGVHYKLRTANSYYPLKKDGTFNRIAESLILYILFSWDTREVDLQE